MASFKKLRCIVMEGTRSTSNALILVVLVLFLVLSYFSENSTWIVSRLVFSIRPKIGAPQHQHEHQVKDYTPLSVITAAVKLPKQNVRETEWSDSTSCDIFNGKWVIDDDDSAPVYQPGSCPFIDDAFNCVRNGRQDSDFMRWRWQPHGCSIPRLDGKQMLEMLRGKRVVFVGDSLNRNMWESLVCSLRASLMDQTRVFEASGLGDFRTHGYYSVRFQDYNSSIEFVRAPFLVQEWKLSIPSGGRKETLRLDLIHKSSSIYQDADILIFNTGHWWTHDKTSKGNNYYQEGNLVYGKLEVTEAYAKALHTWAQWVDANINPTRTQVFFRGYSISHYRGGRWNSGGNCDGETQPITNDAYLAPYPQMMSILESVIREMKTPVVYLNITRMTNYRKDAHPSIYRKPNTQRSAGMYQDCSHWCLPGVPDAWNHLLHAAILLSHDKSTQVD